VSYDISKFSNSHDSALSKHREIILDLLKQNKNLDDQIWEKLKEITQIPDLLTDVIYRKIRGDSKSSIPKNKYKEELDEYRKFASNLQTQLVKAKQSNDELSNMLLSVEVQQKLNVVFI
jgi:DNA mismatch repair ATPase MutS